MLSATWLGIAEGAASEADTVVRIDCAELDIDEKSAIEARQLAELFAMRQDGAEMLLACEPTRLRGSFRVAGAKETVVLERPRQTGGDVSEALLALAAELRAEKHRRAAPMLAPAKAHRAPSDLSNAHAEKREEPKPRPHDVSETHAASVKAPVREWRGYADLGTTFRLWGTEAPGMLALELGAGGRHRNWGGRMSFDWGRSVAAPDGFVVSAVSLGLELEWLPRTDVALRCGALVSEVHARPGAGVESRAVASQRVGASLGAWVAPIDWLLVGAGVEWHSAERRITLDGAQSLRIPAWHGQFGAAYWHQL